MSDLKKYLVENKIKYRLKTFNIKTVSQHYGEYFAELDLKYIPSIEKETFRVIFTEKGILYQASSYNILLKYEEIGEISVYSTKIFIRSKDRYKAIELNRVNTDIDLLKSLLEKIKAWNFGTKKEFSNASNLSGNNDRKTNNIKNNNIKVKIKWNGKIDKNVQGLIDTSSKLELLKDENFFKPLKKEIDQKIEAIDKYVSKVKNPLYQIAIVGAIKAGKSSLINALLEEEIVSVDVTPETATLTKFRYSEKNFLNVKFYSKAEWEKIWNETNSQRHKAQGENYLNEYKNLRAEEVKSKYLDRENIYLEFNTIGEIKSEIEKWTSSKHREHFFVKELEIGLNKLSLPEQVCLVDTPGLGDISKYRSDITNRYIESANAVLICINCKTLRNEEYQVINQIFATKNKFKDKIYILGTQIDTFRDTSDWSKQKKDWIKNLKINFENNEKITEEHILGVSSYISKRLVDFKKGVFDRKFEHELYDCEIISGDEADYLSVLRVEQKKYDKKMIEKIIMKANKFTNIEYLKNTIIETKLLNNWNNELIEKFEQDYNLILEEIRSFVKKNSNDIKNNINLINSKYFDKQKKLNEHNNKLQKLTEEKNKLNREIKEIKEEFNKDIKEFKGKLIELDEKTFKKERRY